MKKDFRWTKFRDKVVGLNQLVPLIDGSLVSFDYLDNAASTPPFIRVKEKVDEMLSWYSSMHSSLGFKSLVTTHLYEEAREFLACIVGADIKTETVIYVKNTTEAINKLANRFPFKPDGMVLTTVMEHRANDLPWRKAAKVIYANVEADGSLDLEDFKHKLAQYTGRIQLVAITGASHVSGYLPPIYEIAEWAHAAGAKIFVDCAQLFPHRLVQMGLQSEPFHLDFIALSGHKIYAPFGTGALIGAREILNQGETECCGGGTRELVSLEEVLWAETPQRDEAGGPNVIGAVALAASLQQISELGVEAIERHEKELTQYALTQMKNVEGLELFGFSDPERVMDRTSIIPFQVSGIPHAKVAAILSFEDGIGVGNGFFCAQPYVLKLMNINQPDFESYRNEIQQKNRSHLPGMLRVSFGCYNNYDDIDRLVVALKKIIRGDYEGKYEVEKSSGSYFPVDFNPDSLGKYLTI